MDPSVFNYAHFQKIAQISSLWVFYTDKETDESWDILIYNMKNQFWAGLGSRAITVKKKFGVDYEQLLRLVF